MPKNEFTCDCNAVNTQLVESIVENMPDEKTFDSLAGFYKMLGDTTRCKIIFALLSSEMCVCDLANVLSMSKSAVSHQLGKMKSNGVVRCRRNGKEVYYSLDDEHISEIFTVTAEHIRHKKGEKE
ncbi:MAG: helix-turn-helix transcriptional regulator [Clostridia bacterium]|nr:helix-turn-helix transcriptional regulator [Clostridia bacterium]MBQ6931759.1 helix-turn-helix transcriptional regulator [Clostridia bacterium]MBQ7101309.1 helix-turn-helix transcriptional regulator [Clostridia bacterium]